MCDFQEKNAESSKSFPIMAGALKSGNYIVFEGQICKISTFF